MEDSFHSNERLTFHERCGSLVKLSNNRRTAERRRPLDEFNNGVVMTNRPLKDDELFEVCRSHRDEGAAGNYSNRLI